MNPDIPLELANEVIDDAALLIPAAGDSGIQVDPWHAAARPPGVTEVDGYREVWEAGGETATARVFDVLWGQRAAFRDWVLGYTYSQLDPNGPQPAIPPKSPYGTSAPVYRFKRQIPDQDPEFPWLYAVHLEMIQPQGAWAKIATKNSTVRDIYDPAFGLNQTYDDASDGKNRLYIPKCWYLDSSDNGVGIGGPGGFGGGTKLSIGTTGDNLSHPPVFASTRHGFSDGRARYRVTYKALDYAIHSDQEMAVRGWNATPFLLQGELERYVSRRRTYATKALQINRMGTLRFDDANCPPQFKNVPVPQAGSMLIPIVELTYVWHQVPDPPYDYTDGNAAFGSPADQTRIGRINSDTFDGALGWPSYPPETLLCLAPNFQQSPRNVRGRVTWDIHYKFLFNPNGWNNYPAADGNFYHAQFSSGRPLYLSRSFAPLFQPAPIRYYQYPGQG